MGKIKDLTGQTFGKLTVLEKTNERRNRQVVWKCQCECGNITYVVGQALRDGHTQSCGCKNYESKNKKNLIGQKFGKLLVLQQNQLKSKDRHILWDCQCDCGNIRTVIGSKLLDGSVTQCQNCQLQDGFKKSNGEAQIEFLLRQNNLNFKKQYTFEDCLSPKNSKLLFDFAIFNTNNQLIYLIEYDGIQHYKAIEYFGGEKDFLYRQKCDSIKNTYCKEHNIPLIRISYQQYPITIEDLKPNENL